MLTQMLLCHLYKVFILLAAMPSCRGAERDAPWPPEDLSSPLSEVYLKGFGYAFQDASLECDTIDAPFYTPRMQI